VGEGVLGVARSSPKSHRQFSAREHVDEARDAFAEHFERKAEIRFRICFVSAARQAATASSNTNVPLSRSRPNEIEARCSLFSPTPKVA
jgi:hypothetical protein